MKQVRSGVPGEGQHEEGRGRLPGQKAEDGQGRSDFPSLGDGDAAQEPDTSDPHGLFQELGGGRDPRLFSTQIGARETGMDGRQRDGGGQDPEERSASGFVQDPQGDPVRLSPEQESRGTGGGQAHGESGVQPGGAVLVFFKSGEAGDGGLHSGSGQRMADGENGKNKLIDSHSLRTQGLCQEYLIEEAKKTAQKTGSRKDQRPF